MFLIVVMNDTLAEKTGNRTDDWKVYHELSNAVCILLAVIMIVTLIVGTIGNTLVLALFIKYKSLRTASNIFIASLTIADLMMCLCGVPTLINNYIWKNIEPQLSEFFCYCDTFIGAFTGFGAIWSLMALAVDRCVVISRRMPVKHLMDKRIAYYVTATIWIISLAFAMMPFIGFGRYVVEGSKLACSGNNFKKSFSNILYNIVIQVLYFCIPVTCMISCYSMIFLKVRNHELKYFDAKKDGNVDHSAFRRMRKHRKLERNELKTAKAGLILISVFCLSWLPYSVVSWIGLFGNRYTLTPLAVALPALFAKVSTIFNPLLYALLLRSFKIKLGLFYNQHFRLTRSSYGSSERTHLDVIHNLDESRRATAATAKHANGKMLSFV